MNLLEQIDNLLIEDPFEIHASIKKEKLMGIMQSQMIHHLENCNEYNSWFKQSNFQSPEKIEKYEDVPFIPSAVFKYARLSSVKEKGKIIKSSGTSSDNRSEIFINNQTSNFQKKALSKILSSFLGKKRKPFFIVDTQPIASIDIDGSMTARFAGMSGYLMAAKTNNYLLKKNESGELDLDFEVFEKLLGISKKEPVVLIGYTYMIWEYLINNQQIDFDRLELNENSKLIHFGGWKKLRDKNLDKKELVKKVTETIKVSEENIFDIYGFSEQLGTVYVSQGNEGAKVCSYANVLVRDMNTLEVVQDGQTGFMQFISALPTSYPGFSILNDDIGFISSRSGKDSGKEFLEFKIHSRLEKSENRGCGDTLPENYYI